MKLTIFLLMTIAIFLLISPGAGPQGSGEAQVAKADDAYASYYNPAGLGFLKGNINPYT